ncbi:hypothetical protein WPS_30220 [Vulcanimicrobium alpinum]|uniref:Uncharacterized protein n=1 Tax=Vulcanimicrobium alpinum TaxID=3016050 RepID=A0AAN1XZP9_UNVUL|nr:hypothetical protein WPS_30220 [Vulcanimicrobium alpinum]
MTTPIAVDGSAIVTTCCVDNVGVGTGVGVVPVGGGATEPPPPVLPPPPQAARPAAMLNAAIAANLR